MSILTGLYAYILVYYVSQMINRNRSLRHNLRIRFRQSVSVHDIFSQVNYSNKAMTVFMEARTNNLNMYDG